MNNKPNPVVRSFNFSDKRQLARTLQGYIHKVTDTETNQTMVMKQVYKCLVERRISYDSYPIHEDFKQEVRILIFLSQKSRPQSASAGADSEAEELGVVQVITYWQDNDCYYYTMPYYEASLFTYIQRSFDPISTAGTMYKIKRSAHSFDQVPLKQATGWVAHIQHIFRQLVKTVAWMHSLGVCHLDLSLENTMISDLNSMVLKIIDFGVARQFNVNVNVDDDTNINFRSNKRVGKPGYIAPEVYRKESYDCRKADIWCLGVMLFMMLVGAPLYKIPDTKIDPVFRHVIQGRLTGVLQYCRCIRLVTEQSLDLMLKIFRPEQERISMQQLLSHSFVNLPEPEPEPESSEQDCKHDMNHSQSQNQNHNQNNNFTGVAGAATARPSVDVSLARTRTELNCEEFLQFVKDTISSKSMKHGKLKRMTDHQWTKVFDVIQDVAMDEALFRSTNAKDFAKMFHFSAAGAGISKNIAKALRKKWKLGLKKKCRS